MRRPYLLSLLVSLFLIVLTAATATPSLRAADDGYSYARIVRLSYVSGDVQVVRSDDPKWEPAMLNMPIQQGMTVGTNDGRAEIEFENGGAIWLSADSMVQFTELALSNGGRITKVTLSQGTASFDPKLASGDSMQLITPEIKISLGKAVVRGTVTKDTSSIAVLGGRVTVAAPSGEKELRKGETLTVNANAPTDAKINASNSAPDSWDKWVKERGNLLADGQNQSLQYTDAPFSYGLSDLSTYGGWGFYPGYGYGWQPFGTASGWAPFSVGQWGFYPGLGWTWQSAEPWGWVPYHFGSWQFSPVFGWMWLPGGYNFWSPAPVSWYSVGNQIAWSPVRMGATATAPIVVSSKNLGKGGANKVVTAAGAGEKFEALAGAPLSNGKIGTASELAALQSASGGNAAPSNHKSLQPGSTRFAVPTAGNLSALRTGVGFNPGQNRFVNAAATSGAISAQPIALNGAPPAAKMPHELPPARTLASSGGYGPALARGGQGRMSGGSVHTSSGGSMGGHVGGMHTK